MLDFKTLWKGDHIALITPTEFPYETLHEKNIVIIFPIARQYEEYEYLGRVPVDKIGIRLELCPPYLVKDNTGEKRYYTVISGKVEEGEDEIDTVKRELEEESGVKYEEGSIYRVFQDLPVCKSTDMRASLFVVEIDDFEKHKAEGDGTLNEKQSKTLWVTWNELSEILKKPNIDFLLLGVNSIISPHIHDLNGRYFGGEKVATLQKNAEVSVFGDSNTEKAYRRDLESYIYNKGVEDSDELRDLAAEYKVSIDQIKRDYQLLKNKWGFPNKMLESESSLVKVSSLGNDLYKIGDNEIPINRQELKGIVKEAKYLTFEYLENFWKNLDEKKKAELELNTEAGQGVVVDMYEVDYPDISNQDIADDKTDEIMLQNLDRKDLVNEITIPNTTPNKVNINIEGNWRDVLIKQSWMGIPEAKQYLDEVAEEFMGENEDQEPFKGIRKYFIKYMTDVLNDHVNFAMEEEDNEDGVTKEFNEDSGAILTYIQELADKYVGK